MTHSAADRLRRLRLCSAALFTAVNAAGLVVFAWLVIGGRPRAVRGAAGRLTLNRATASVLHG